MIDILRALIVTDSQSDAELTATQLKKAGFKLEWKRVDTEADYLTNLDKIPDIVLSDCSLSHFNALRALYLLKKNPQTSIFDIPFIIVSTSIDDKTAIKAFEGGASDCLDVEHLARLGFIVTRELEKKRLKHEYKVATTALEETNKQLQTLINTSPVATVMLNRKGRLQMWNHTAATIFDWREDEVKDQIVPLVASRELHTFVSLRNKVLKGKAVANLRTQLQRKDGSLVELSVLIKPLYNDEKQVTGVLVTLIDITEHKAVAEALRESEKRYRQLFEVISDTLILVEHENGQILEANNAAPILYGYDREELLSMTVAELSVEPQETSKVFKAIKPAPDHVLTIPLQWHCKKDGTKFPVEITIHTFIWKDRSVHIATIRDITERKQLEDTLREREEHFRSLYENATIGLYRTTPGGKIVMANPAIIRMLGYTSLEELTQRNLEKEGFESTYPREGFRQVIEDKGVVSGIETVWQRKDGSAVWVRESAKGIRDEKGNLLYYDGTVEDITERKLAEQTLQEREERYRLITDNINDTVWLMDLDLNFVYVSPSIMKLSGHTAEEFSAKPFTQHLTPTSLEQVLKAHKNILTAENNDNPPSSITQELEFTRKDGSQTWCESTFTLICDSQGNPTNILGIGRDISERKQATQEIQHRVTELEVLYENGLIISGLLEPKEIGQRLLEVLAEKLNWHHAAVRLYNSTTKHIQIIAFNQPGMTDAEKEEHIQRLNQEIKEPGQGFSGWVIKHGEIVRCGDVLKDERYMATFPGIHSGLYVPIKVGDRTIGSISVESAEKNAFKEQDERLLVTLAAQAAVAIENARLYQVMQHELTERTRAQAALIEAEHFARSTVDALSTHIAILDEHGNMIAANKAWQDFAQKNPETTAPLCKGINYLQICDEASGPNSQKAQSFVTGIRSIMAGDIKQFSMEYPYLLPNKQFWFVGKATPFPGDGPLRVVISHQDITERKIVELELTLNEEKFRSVIEQSVDGIMLADQEGRVIEWNDGQERITGYTRGEVVSRPLWDIPFKNLLPDTGANMKTSLMQLLKNGEAPWINQKIERDFQHIDGTMHTIQSVFFPIRTAKGFMAASISRDTTESKQSERFLRQYAARLQALFEIDREILAAQTTPQAIARSVLSYILQLTTSQRVSIALFNHEEDEAILYSLKTDSSIQHDYGVRKHLTSIWIPQIKKGKEIVLDDLTNESQDFPLAIIKTLQLEEMRSVVIIPLMAQDEVIGLLNLASSQPNAFNDTHIGTAREMSVQVAIAIRQAQLYEQIQRHATELEKRVEERTVELRTLNAALERASRLKDEFLASMSHELRTPLTGILNISEALQEQIYGSLSEKQLHFLRMIESSGRHLLGLINDILDVSKIEAGQLKLEMDNCILADICQGSLQMIKSISQKKNLEISYEMTPPNIKILADPRRLKQVLVNLLSNAVKFTPANGKIGLNVKGDIAAGVVYFDVWDTGIGIPKEDIPRLFLPFTQLDSSLSRQHSGTGLGLTIVQRLADLHGGSISVESTPGQGSRFTMTLPWNIAAPDAPGRPRRRGGTKPFESEKPARYPRDSTILVADDNDININFYTDYLEQKGFKVIVAHNGEQAIQLAREKQPHLILMDIQMPGLDGLEATRRIRSSQEPLVSQIPIIALTALAMPGDAERCLQVGASEYLSKPVSLKVLMHTLQDWLSIDE